MKIIYIFVILAMIYGCKDTDSAKTQSTSQNPNTKSAKLDSNPAQNIDTTESSTLDSSVFDLSKDFSDVFLDSRVIASQEKPIIIIFGANYCKPCQKLKDDITSSPALQELLGHYFASYFINISQNLHHTITIQSHIKELDTRGLRDEFGIQATPSFGVVDSHGKTLYKYIGAINKPNLKTMLNFLKSSTNQTLTQKEITEALQELYAKNT